jgi:hypothetical protein
VIGRAERRAARFPRVAGVFTEDAVETVLDLFEVMEIAWHDLYGEISPPESIVDDVLDLSGGDLAALISATHLALTDERDLKVAVQRRRS